jgi:hypothetical protein
MARGLIFLFSLFATVACTTPVERPNRSPDSFKIEYRYEDSPQQKKILLYFRNASKEPVCFGPGNWPENGILLNPGGEVSLEVAGQRYFLGPENDYCPRCNKKVSPGEEIQGFFNYNSFGLPKQVEPMEKKLNYSPVGFNCQ